MASEKITVPLRIVMADPVSGAVIALQRGATDKGDLVGPVEASAEALVFDLEVIVDGALPDGGLRLLGPFVQGPPTGRFVYINSGSYAGDPASPSSGRRAKVPLGGLTWALIQDLPPGGRLEARIAGRARDGGVACATVLLLAPGWKAIA